MLIGEPGPRKCSCGSVWPYDVVEDLGVGSVSILMSWPTVISAVGPTSTLCSSSWSSTYVRMPFMLFELWDFTHAGVGQLDQGHHQRSP